MIFNYFSFLGVFLFLSRSKPCDEKAKKRQKAKESEILRLKKRKISGHVLTACHIVRIFGELTDLDMEYQKQDDKIHRCLECGDKIRYGRTDKKFCCQACRAKHHNTILKEGRLYRRKVLSTLTKNYQLLESLIESGIDSIELTDIMSMGFSPHMVTSCYKMRRFEEYGCFDIKYKLAGTRIYSISKIQNVSLTLRFGFADELI